MAHRRVIRSQAAPPAGGALSTVGPKLSFRPLQVVLVLLQPTGHEAIVASLHMFLWFALMVGRRFEDFHSSGPSVAVILPSAGNGR